MNIDALVPWTPDFAARGPMYAPLAALAKRFSAFTRWPDLRDYQDLLDAWPEPIRTQSGRRLSVAAQAGKPGCFEEHYAPRIYHTGEIQTRTENWHDFFQLLTWFVFPATKAVINALHLPHARERIVSGGDKGRRSPLENMLSLFDEGGVVVVSSDASLLQLVRDFRWKELFWTRRAEVEAKFACIAFGHAVYEKGLMPYVGMTANAILLHAEAMFHDWPLTRQLAWIDAELAQLLRERVYTKPKDLSPFPLLGMPGWDPANACEAYYDNTAYFRPGRRAPIPEAT